MAVQEVRPTTSRDKTPTVRTRPGSPYPLGATWDGAGVNFALFSENATRVDDGFTLEDLVSYNDKHNEANGEGNRDGHDHNLSWNHGVEGPTTDAKILALRDRQKRSFLATLLLSQGVPMPCGGRRGRPGLATRGGHVWALSLTRLAPRAPWPRPARNRRARR